MGYPLRTTIKEHVYSFRNYAKGANCFYLCADKRESNDNVVPEYFSKIEFDAIIFHYGFVGARWEGIENLKNTMKRVDSLKNTKAIKIILPQDEYKNPNALVHFINEFNVDMVFSVSPETEWEKLYKGVDFEKVKFFLTLTGYLDSKAVKGLAKLVNKIPKTIDIGYRARNLPPWLGRHGFLKTLIAEKFLELKSKYPIKMDISTKTEDTFIGSSWYDFLVKCKYMIGVEGGSTVLDEDGSIWNKGVEFQKKHPKASFEEVEEACFPGKDGQLNLVAISPRHLECCATKTCQILTEGDYNGILKSGVHYIELKKDFSNLDSVLIDVVDDNKRKQIVENAYNDIVLSKKYTYSKFVKETLEIIRVQSNIKVPKKNNLLYLRNRIEDQFVWVKAWYRLKVWPIWWKQYLNVLKVLEVLGIKNILSKLKAR